jgi:phage-related tail fiber protein
MSSAPSGWLKANGAAVSRSTYSDLFAAIGTTYGSGDGSSTFNLPDLRGEFLRGWDDGRGVDSGRGFGSFQSHAYGSHNHNFRVYDYGGGGYQNVFGYPQAITNGGDRAARGSYNAEKDHLVQYSGGSETRPRNVALLVCIKT